MEVVQVKRDLFTENKKMETAIDIYSLKRSLKSASFDVKLVLFYEYITFLFYISHLVRLKHETTGKSLEEHSIATAVVVLLLESKTV